MVLTLLAGCSVLTPAARLGIQVVSCRHDNYVQSDPLLDEDQKAARLRMSSNLRESVGIDRSCPDVGR